MRKKFLQKYGVLVIVVGVVACSAGGASSSPAVVACPKLPVPQESNYMTIMVTPNDNDSGLCSLSNSPCVSVTVCSSVDKSQCVKVRDILLDSGSSGLRIFKSELHGMDLPEVALESSPLYECIDFTDQKHLWGSVNRTHAVFDGGVEKSMLNIQLLEASNKAATCARALSSPQSLGYNGILGVSPLLDDRGSYYICNGTTCQQVNIESSQKVVNPISLLDDDNNGIVIKLPSIPSGGCFGGVGYAVFGIATKSDNIPESSVVSLSIATNPLVPLYIPAQLNGNNVYAFLDSGSNTVSFSNPNIALCSFSNAYYCPPETILQDVILYSSDLLQRKFTKFATANAGDLFLSGNSAFSNLGSSPFSSALANYLDLGLPFFYGKVVYIGFNGKSSSLGRGMYWAF